MSRKSRSGEVHRHWLDWSYLDGCGCAKTVMRITILGAFRMWSDVETRKDYLNFAEVAEAVTEILLDPAMRPVSVGIFGTWGTGKSSVLNLIEAQLTEEAKDKVILIRFDAWLYQGYDDARAALMEVIARTLYEEAKKDAGIVGLGRSLLGRVNTLRTLGQAIEVVAAAHGMPMFGAGAKALGGLKKFVTGDPSEEDAKAVADGGKAAVGLIDPAAVQTPPQAIDAFRREFAELLGKLGKTLIVFVDNLDRCLPEQTIHTLEALRLFLFMEQSAFVVAADEDMVRNSVARHFGGIEDKHVTDYLDKLIQIPFVSRAWVWPRSAHICSCSSQKRVALKRPGSMHCVMRSKAICA